MPVSAAEREIIGQLDELGGEYEEDSLPGFARQLVDYTVKMDAIEREELGQWLIQDIRRYYEHTEDRRSKVREWRDAWELLSVPSVRWKGASEVCSPLARIFCAQHHTRLNAHILGYDPPFQVQARSEAALDAAPQIEECTAAALEEASWKRHADRTHDELVQTGNCFLRLTYEEDWRRIPKVGGKWDAKLFKTLVNGDVDPMAAFGQSVKRKRNGDPDLAPIWEMELFDAGPRFKVIPWEDGIILPAGIRDPKQARAIGERLSISGHELKLGVKQKKYYADAVERLLQRREEENPEERQQRYQDQGIDPEADLTPALDTHPEHRWYTCYELCVWHDFNNDGYMECALVLIENQLGEILRAHYLPYEHGRETYQLLRYIERTNELWGMGVFEMLHGLHDAHTALINQAIDANDLKLAARNMFFYNRGSVTPGNWIFEMARPIPCDDVQGIKEIPFQGLSAETFALMDQLKVLGELLTATSNPTLGRVTEGDKTKGEIELVAAAAAMVFEGIAGNVGLQWAEVFDRFRWILAQLGADDEGQVRYRVSAKPGAILTREGSDGQPQQVQAAMIQGQPVAAPMGYAFGTIDADLLRAEVDFVPIAVSQQADPQVRAQQAATVLSTLTEHPVTAGNVPVLILLIDNFLQSIKFPQRQRVMDGIQRQYEAQMAAQKLQLGLAMKAAQGDGAMAGEADAAAADQVATDAELAQVQQAQQIAAQQQQLEAGAQPPVVTNP